MLASLTLSLGCCNLSLSGYKRRKCRPSRPHVLERYNPALRTRSQAHFALGLGYKRVVALRALASMSERQLGRTLFGLFLAKAPSLKNPKRLKPPNLREPEGLQIATAQAKCERSEHASLGLAKIGLCRLKACKRPLTQLLVYCRLSACRCMCWLYPGWRARFAHT